jgi:hypothetical protein
LVKDSREHDGLIRWLLEGDPAIRWQVLRDLVGAPAQQIGRERKKVAVDGWGAALLAGQDARGTWARGQSSNDGLYSPKWISTHRLFRSHRTGAVILERLGAPSRWNTLRALRVLRWWDRKHQE